MKNSKTHSRSKRLAVSRIICLFLCCLFLFSVCPGCSWFKPKEEKTAQELLEDGMKAYKKKRYMDAIESFKKLKDWYPFDKSALTAELKIADAHFELKEYDEAELAYEEFENLHPRNPDIPYVLYRMGKCHFIQIDTVDRDQNPAKKALEQFKRLTKQFPDDPYAKKAKKHIFDCYKSLAGHELYVARWQFKTKRYKGALARFQGIITDYPDVDTHKEALMYIPLCKAAMEKKEKELKKKKKKDFTQ